MGFLQFMMDIYQPYFSDQNENKRMTHSTIKEAFWEITTHCNANCVHCSVAKNKDISVSDDDRKVILEKLVGSGVNDITITGGEPTLVDLKSVLSCFDLNKLFLRVCTNGLCLDDELLQFFNRNGIGYNVSFQSLAPNTGRVFYGVDTHWVEPLINRLLNSGKKELFALNTAILSLNLNEIPEIAAYLNARPEKIRKWRLLNPIETGRLLQNPQYIVSPQEVRALKKELEYMNLSFPVLVNAEARSDKRCSIEKRKEVYITQYGAMRPCLGLTYVETEKSLLTHSVDELLAEPVMDFWVNKYATDPIKTGACLVSNCSPCELQKAISACYEDLK